MIRILKKRKNSQVPFISFSTHPTLMCILLMVKLNLSIDSTRYIFSRQHLTVAKVSNFWGKEIHIYIFWVGLFKWIPKAHSGISSGFGFSSLTYSLEGPRYDFKSRKAAQRGVVVWPTILFPVCLRFTIQRIPGQYRQSNTAKPIMYYKFISWAN